MLKITICVSPDCFCDIVPGRCLPRGLMVFSSVSLSLLDFPLDIRAAMENALARDESCGFGDDVYSISGGEPDQNIPLKINEPTEIPQKLLLVFHQQRGNQQIRPARPVSNGALWEFDRTHVGPDRPQRLLRVLRLGLMSDARLLFGKLQLCSYNSCSPPIRASAPTSRSHRPSAAPIPNSQ